MGMQDRDYVRERKLDYGKSRQAKPDLSNLKYFQPINKKRWLAVAAWFAVVAVILWFGTH